MKAAAPARRKIEQRGKAVQFERRVVADARLRFRGAEAEDAAARSGADVTGEPLRDLDAEAGGADPEADARIVVARRGFRGLLPRQWGPAQENR